MNTQDASAAPSVIAPTAKAATPQTSMLQTTPCEGAHHAPQGWGSHSPAGAMKIYPIKAAGWFTRGGS